ncbi:hypothetical protein ACFL28_01400 [Candidatus Omnitrophota bacterium]
MRRKVLSLVVLVAFLALSSLSFAQELDEAKGSMKDRKEAKKGGMKGMMMKKMMEKEMVASGDGGVIVLVGNKLLKYDKDLNLVKEVEIKMDKEGMMKECMEMKKKWCPKTEEGSE